MPVATEGRLTINLGVDLKAALDERARREGRSSTDMVKLAVLTYLQTPAHLHPDVASLLAAAGTHTSPGHDAEQAAGTRGAGLADLLALVRDLDPLLRMAATRQQAIEEAIKANHNETLDAIDDLAGAIGRRLGAGLAIEQLASPIPSPAPPRG